MSKIEKALERWKKTGQPAPKTLVKAVLDKYFPGRYREGRGSHIVVEHPALKGLPGFADGRFTVPIKGGQKVKPLYLRNIVKVIEYLVEIGEVRKEEVE
jgi:predicted RNA binding protein YcfA (HicA-like mRNA interferase family)